MAKGLWKTWRDKHNAKHHSGPPMITVGPSGGMMRIIYRHEHHCSRKGQEHVINMPIVDGVFEWPDQFCAERVINMLDRTGLTVDLVYRVGE